MRERRTFTKFIVFLAAFLAAVLALCGAGFLCLLSLKPVYNDTFYAGLKIKYDRLVSVDSPKIVVIGGSSLAFGIDSKLVEKETGMECVNFGLYAAIGLKPMMDLSKKSIRRGDVVILAPELSAQMYSDYIGYEYLLESVEGRPDMALQLGGEYAKGFLASLPGYFSRRAEILKNGLNVEGVYACSSFDPYGDVVFTRNENVMKSGYSKTDLPEITTKILRSGFFDMVNSYARYCRSRGAAVYFGFPPVNALSVNIESAETKAFLSELRARLDMEILSSLEDHVLDAGYFYDSNFHVNDPGTVYNTILLINDVKRVTGNMTAVSVPLPEPLMLGSEGESSELMSDGTFNYVLSEKGVAIKGLTETGKALETLTVPAELGGYKVTALDESAFADSRAKSIMIPETVSSIREGIFSNAVSLKAVYFHCLSLPEVSSDMLYLAPEDLTLYVKKEVYGKFLTDYFWGVFSDRLKPME